MVRAARADLRNTVWLLPSGVSGPQFLFNWTLRLQSKVPVRWAQWRVPTLDLPQTARLQSAPRFTLLARQVYISSSRLARAWVERVAQTVAQQVDAHHRGHDREARKERDPPRGVEILPPVGEHAAPRRRRRRDAETQKRQRRFENDGARDLERPQHD